MSEFNFDTHVASLSFFAGEDFPDVFADNRHSQAKAMAFTSGNGYDPESLITGEEVERGLTYGDKRAFPGEEVYLAYVGGQLSPDNLPVVAPRVHREVTP